MTSHFHLANELWPMRNKFRALHQTDFATELTLLQAVTFDLQRKFYHDLTTAIAFYKDLNLTTREST